MCRVMSVFDMYKEMSVFGTVCGDMSVFGMVCGQGKCMTYLSNC